MSSPAIELITSSDPTIRDRSFDSLCSGRSLSELLVLCDELDAFWRTSENLYERVRALFFLYSAHRFHIPAAQGLPRFGCVPYRGFCLYLNRRFEESIDVFLQGQQAEGSSDTISSALASAYHSLAFQTLANQVRRSVRSVPGNQWMFRMGHPADQPLRVKPELLSRHAEGPFPLLHEQTPVRMDLSHSAWSDIFFLGMDFPAGARVLNVSIDLAVHGRDRHPRPPVNAYFRVIDEPVLRLVSVDLATQADITQLDEVYDFARDYLGLLKAALIASGLVPPGLEGSEQKLSSLLARLVGAGNGIELVSQVNNIPKGSRLAVSTNLLASLISVCMRATGQTAALTGSLTENERRLVLARAILGEWLAGSGGGWQDSGGVWPGIKLIQGVEAEPGDLEHGISRGCLLPRHTILGTDEVSAAARTKLQESLVLVHGGMAQDVGPILEMVTEKYLLRSEKEWVSRQDAIQVLDDIVAALKAGDIKRLGALTTRNFFEPLQQIIPWASTDYTERLIRGVQEKYGEAFWGFWMLGGMSGGGMGFIFEPSIREEAQRFLKELMLKTKQENQHALPFAMDPVVYDFSINERGTFAELSEAQKALMPPGYYEFMVPIWVREDPSALPPGRKRELESFGRAGRSDAAFAGMTGALFDRLFPPTGEEQKRQSLDALLEAVGYDPGPQEDIRSELKAGRLGMAQNRLPATTQIEDVKRGDVADAVTGLDAECVALGEASLRHGEVAVFTLAAGTGSRWTQGAGVVKALHPFCRLAGRHRSFIETHLAKSRRVSRQHGASIPHVFTTSYLTHAPIRDTLALREQYGYEGPLYLSSGRAVGIRMVPMVRDLRFAWEEMPQQLLDEQAQKMRESLNSALINWAQEMGEGSDYTDNLPMQCLHPVGHWFEISNLLRNGTLHQMLQDRPALRYLMLHNIDTVGADVDPAVLGEHIRSGACLSFEVINRRIEDMGGGLACVDGRLRLLEGLAMPNEQAEFGLSYYSSMTTWIDIDQLLEVFGLTRQTLGDEAAVAEATRRLASKLPTYITIKEVKKRWGHGQEDIFPVSQYEKLWGDMTALSEVECRFISVPRVRGQQLKDQAQLDGWLRDGSAAYIESICDFG
ncbi:MAG: UTP--glucose-1-phosphate uridylyltransferase [Lentisphaerae bacterium]|nr:UTP--glucose-1-phosphate uridylyltransferase [Lentisphaerota bacterium]